jgi:hypothetical protein
MSLLNLKESDVFMMMPGKVGPARKVWTLLEKMKCKEQHERNIEGYRIVEYKENTDGVKTIKIEPATPLTKSVIASDSPQPIGGLHITESDLPIKTESISGHDVGIIEYESSAKVSRLCI